MERSSVGARELKTRLGTYLNRVRAGRTILVTDRGEPVAELRPVPELAGVAGALLRLSRAGSLMLPARKTLKPFPPIRHQGRPLSRAVVEDREDRF